MTETAAMGLWTQALCLRCERKRNMPTANLHFEGAGICENCRISSPNAPKPKPPAQTKTSDKIYGRWALPGLRGAMARADVTAELLATQVKLSGTTLHAYAKGDARSTPEAATALADALGVPVSELRQVTSSRKRRSLRRSESA